MPNYQISAVLNAQITGFRQNMNEASRSSAQAANTIDNNMNRIDASARRAGRGVDESARQIRQSGNRYLEFGRVLQDLPFGFQGIQNNLTQIIPAAGAAGLAFSAIVSAITFASVGTGAWTRGLKDNKEAIDNATLSGEDYIKTLTGIAQAQLKGSQDAQEELTQLRSLYRVATDVTISVKQRKDAVDALQKEYPKYFKNLSDEAIMTGRAKEAYDGLAQSILATARARAAESKITSNAIRQLEDESKIQNLRIDQQKALNKEREAARVANFIASQGSTSPGGSNIVAERNLYNARAEREKLDKQIIDLATDHNKLTAENLRLEKEVTKQVKAGADLADYTASKAAQGVRFPKSDIGDTAGRKDFMDPTFAYRQRTAIKALLEPLNEYESGVAQFQNNLSDSQQRAISGMLDFNSTFQASVEALGSSTVVDGISNGFTAIGEALYSGASVFQAAGEAILQTVSGFLSELGEMLIKKGIATVAAGTALNFLAPGSGTKQILGGLGLIGAGAALSVAAGIGTAALSGGSKKRPSNVTAFAGGGVVYGPTNALIGEYAGAKNNPEVVAPLNKLKGMLGQNTFQPVLIPVINSKQLAILVKDGNDKLNRQ